MTYRRLVQEHGLTIGFGFLLALLSSFGQTFFIALSVPGIQADFGLSHGAVGMLFSVATLASGMIMIYAGGILDRISVRTYAVISISGLAAAALLMAVANSIALVALAVLALRLFGQGTLSHAAVTSTAKLPAGIRGRAVSFASLGFQAGTALLPAFAVALIAAIGWSATWGVSSGFLLICLASLMFGRRSLPRIGSQQPHAQLKPDAKITTRREVLSDWRFWVLVPTMMGPSAISTGYFFHQLHIVESMGWSLRALALGMVCFAAGSVTGTLFGGWLADRTGSVRLSRYHLLPLAAASVILAVGSGASGTLIFFALIGLTGGANRVVVTTSLAEMYGSRSLGTIRAMAASFMVIASSITPGVFGIAIDVGVGLETLGLVAAGYLVAASLLNLLLPARRIRS